MISDQCISCKHYRGVFTCDAFPKGIPDEISEGSFDHKEPHEGDQGIRYETDDLWKAKEQS